MLWEQKTLIQFCPFGLATRHGILPTQWMLLIPVFTKQVYPLVTAMTVNSSLLLRGHQQHRPSNSQLPMQDHNSRCSRKHFGGFWSISEHDRPFSVRTIQQKKQIPLAPTKTLIHAFGAPKPLRLRGKFRVAVHGVGEQSYSRHVLRQRSTNGLFIELWNFHRTWYITTTIKGHFWKC